MHVIAIILAIAGGIVYLLWRVNAFWSVSEQVTNRLVGMKAGVRRGYWAWRARERPLKQIDTPMLAATCVMVLAVRCDRDPTPTDRDRMVEQAVRVFGIGRAEADTLVSEAVFAVRGVSDEVNWAARLGKRLHDRTTEAERAQVLDMIRAVAVAGDPSHPQRHLAQRYARAAGLPPPALSAGDAP